MSGCSNCKISSHVIADSKKSISQLKFFFTRFVRIINPTKFIVRINFSTTGYESVGVSN